MRCASRISWLRNPRSPRAQAEQAAWEQRVSGLRGNHLELDTLDERARAMLNLAQPDEIVVPYPQSQRLF